MVYLRVNKKDGKYYFALYESRRLKRGRDKGKVVTKQVRRLGTTEDLLRLILAAEEPISKKPPRITKIREFGALIGLFQLVTVIKLEDVFKKYISGKSQKKARLLTLIVLNKAVDAKTKRQLALWYPKTVLPELLELPTKEVYPESLCAALDALPTKSINLVLSDLLNRADQLYGVDTTKLLLDASTIIFEGNRCILLQFGYNAKYKGRKQILVFLVLTEDKNFPVHLKVFPGNTHVASKTVELASLVRKKFPNQEILFVTDNGFFTGDNLSRLSKANIGILTRLEKSNLVARAAITAVGDSFEDLGDPKGRTLSKVLSIEAVAEYIPPKTHRKNEILTQFRKTRLVVIKTPQGDKAAIEFQTRIDKMERALRHIQSQCAQQPRKQYDPTIAKVYEVTKGLRSLVHFSLQKDDTTGQLNLQFSLRQDRIYARKQLMGKFVLITNRPDLLNKEMFDIYLSKFSIEDAYRTLKTEMDIETPYHRLVNRVKVDLLMSVIAYFLWQVLHNILRLQGEQRSVKDILDVLSCLKEITLNDTVRCYNEADEALTLLNTLNVKLPSELVF